MHGCGVFAKCEIPKGTLICYYDGQHVSRDQLVKQHLPITHALTDPKNPNMICVGFEEPKNEWGIGQITNDYCKPEIKFENFNPLNKMNQFLLKELFDAYTSIANINSSIYLADEFTMRTRRIINKDEELTYSYGSAYWINQQLMQTRSCFWCVLLLSLLPLPKFCDMDVEYARLIQTKMLNLPDDHFCWKQMNIPSDLLANKKLEMLCTVLNCQQW